MEGDTKESTIYALRTTANREDQVMSFVSSNAKRKNLAVLAETKRTKTGKEIFLIKEIEAVSKINAISARFMYIELGEILAINGKGYKYIEKPKLKQNPFDLITDEFCLLFAKDNYPKLVCYEYESLLEIYTSTARDLLNLIE